MEQPSADNAQGGSPPREPQTTTEPATPPARRRRRALPRPPDPNEWIDRRLAGIQRSIEQAGLATVSPRNKTLLQIVDKLDHIHDDLLALREWARIPRPECYPGPPPEPARHDRA